MLAKRLVIFCFLCFIFFTTKAQYLGIQITDNYKGKNTTFFYEKQKDTVSFSMGVIFHINEEIKTDLKSHHLYRKKFKSKQINQLFGLEFGLARTIKSFGDNSLQLMANVQVTRLSLYNYSFLSSEDILGTGHKYDGILEKDQFVLELLETKPMIQVENNFGVALRSNISKQLQTNIFAGIGFIHVNNNDPRIFASKIDWLTHKLSVSIVYSFFNRRN